MPDPGGITAAELQGVHPPHYPDTVHIYGGHRHPLSLAEWHGLSPARMLYRVHLRVTIAAGQTIRVTGTRSEGTMNTVSYDGALADEYADPPIFLPILDAPGGVTVPDCTPPVADADLPMGHAWRLRLTRIERTGEAIVHGALVEVVHLLGYTDPDLVADNAHFELVDATTAAMQYEFLDSWAGQRVVADSLARLAFEARALCYVPFFGEVPP